MDDYDIMVRIPEYAVSQIGAQEALHPVQGRHQIAYKRRMQVIARDDHQVRAFDGHHEIAMTDAFFAAFATPVERPKARKRKSEKTTKDIPDDVDMAEDVTEDHADVTTAVVEDEATAGDEQASTDGAGNVE